MYFPGAVVLVCFIISLAINIITLYCYNKSKLHTIHVHVHVHNNLLIEQRQSSSSSSSIEVHTIPPAADYENFHPKALPLETKRCNAYETVNRQ